MRIVNQFLRSSGGEIDAIADYSSVVTEFSFNAEGYSTSCTRLLVTVEDSTGMDAGKYGNNITLTNGINLLVLNSDDTVEELLTPEPIFTNAEWGTFCYDVDLKTWGAGNDLLLVRWTFDKAGSPVDLKKDQRLVVQLNDDFTGLVKHRFLVQGSTQGG
jgi:hypothetical protein